METDGNEAQRPQEPTGRATVTTWDSLVPHVKCHLPTRGCRGLGSRASGMLRESLLPQA